MSNLMNKIHNIKVIKKKINKIDSEIKFHLHFKDNLNSHKWKGMMTNIRLLYYLKEEILIKEALDSRIVSSNQERIQIKFKISKIDIWSLKKVEGDLKKVIKKERKKLKQIHW